MLNVRKEFSSTSFDRIKGTMQNMAGFTIGALSEVRAKIYNAAGVLLVEDLDFYGPVPNGGQSTFDILVLRSDAAGASYYTLEVTNFTGSRDNVLTCNGCGRRNW